ncbi:MAG: WbqC family protein [Bacteroidales bacterium]
MNTQASYFSTAYFPPVEYMARMMQADKILIEGQETYARQTYRNRCIIQSANGPLMLTVPVRKIYGNHTRTSDIRVSYQYDWATLHIRALEAAYNASPYFLYYKDALQRTLSANHETLLGLNMALLKQIMEWLNWEKEAGVTKTFHHRIPDGKDLRFVFHPGRTTENAPAFPVYIQVFSEKHGFQPNLSILDLLFNLGNETTRYLAALNSGSTEFLSGNT